MNRIYFGSNVVSPCNGCSRPTSKQQTTVIYLSCLSSSKSVCALTSNKQNYLLNIKIFILGLGTIVVAGGIFWDTQYNKSFVTDLLLAHNHIKFLFSQNICMVVDPVTHYGLKIDEIKKSTHLSPGT